MLAAHLERHLRSWQGPDPLKPLGLATGRTMEPLYRTLVELLLAAGLGTVLCGALLQLLLGDLRLTGAMAQRLQARRQQQRALALIREEAELGYGVVAYPQP